MLASLPPSRRRVVEAVAIVLLALLLNLAGNGRVSLWDRDEPRYAGCVREMRERGDWVHPTFNAEPRYQKPILIYWLMRLGVALGGDNPFGMRLFSACSGAGTCLLVLALGRRMFGPRAGFLAALMLTTAPIMIAESKLATIDATLTLVLVGCQFCLWELSQRPSRGLAASFWVLLALATLLKGPVGPALIAVAGVVSWWWGGPTSCWKRLQWRWGPALFLMLTAPWFVAVGVISKGEFFRVALGEQLLHRLARVMEHHEGIPGYYLLTTLALFHPWSALLPAALLAGWTRRKEQPAFGFLLGWVIGPFLLLECVRTKIFHYYLPAYPACALLSAWLIDALVREEGHLRRWPLGRLATGLLVGVGIGFTALLVGTAVMLPAPRWACLTMAALLATGTLWALERFLKGATESAVQGLAATWALVMLSFGAWMLPALEPYKLAPIVAERLAQLSARHRAQPALLTFQEPSIVYKLGRPLPSLRTWPTLFEHLERQGSVLMPTLPKEAKVLVNDPRISAEEVDRCQGFNLSRGRDQTIVFVLIRPRKHDADFTLTGYTEEPPARPASNSR